MSLLMMQWRYDKRNDFPYSQLLRSPQFVFKHDKCRGQMGESRVGFGRASFCTQPAAFDCRDLDQLECMRSRMARAGSGRTEIPLRAHAVGLALALLCSTNISFCTGFSRTCYQPAQDTQPFDFWCDLSVCRQF